MSACDKKMNVTIKETGYKVVKIASIDVTNEETTRYLDKCNENEVCYYENEFDKNGNSVYTRILEIDINTKEITEIDPKSIKRETFEFPFTLNADFEFVEENGQTYEVRTYTYISDSEEKVFAMNKVPLWLDQNKFKGCSSYFMDLEGNAYFYMEENDEIVVSLVKEGAVLEEIKRIPLYLDGFELENFDYTGNEETSFYLYKNEQANRYYIDGEYVEYEKGWESSKVGDYFFISKMNLRNQVLQTKVIDWKSKKETSLDIACIPQGINERQFVFDNDYKNIGMIQDDGITIYQLPFDFEYVIETLDEKQFLCYPSLYEVDEVDVYLVTITE